MHVREHNIALNGINYIRNMYLHAIHTSPLLGQYIYREVAAMTEVEIVRHFKATPAELGIEKVSVINEENVTKDLFPVGLEGLPVDVALGVRKLRLYNKAGVLLDELLVCPDRQVDKEQGTEVYKLAVKSHLSSRAGSLKSAGKLQIARDLLEKGEEIEEKKQAAMEMLAAPGSGDDDDDEEDQFGYRTSGAAAPKIVRDPTANTGSMLAAASKRKPNPRAKKKPQKEDDDEDDEEEEGASEGGLTGVSGLGGMAALASADPEMSKVAKKHASIVNRPEAPCFFHLSVDKALQKNNKLGRQVTGVTGQVYAELLLQF